MVITYHHDQESPKIYLEGGCKNVLFLFPDLYILFKYYQFCHIMIEEIYKFKIFGLILIISILPTLICISILISDTILLPIFDVNLLPHYNDPTCTYIKC